MCGLVGALTFEGTSFSISADYITTMRETLVHRGPDGAGTWVSDDRRIGLGHRRLAIIDLSEQALQPMSNANGTLWLSYNGEIYNHAEIRNELESLGHRHWKTDHSDTEVILHAFDQWGISAIEKFRGMFAFALWDAKEKNLWLVRDRLGIKPLYYSIHHGRITFASEIKALLKDPDQTRRVNEESLYHYLSFLTSPAPSTLFEGIYKLPAATWLKINSKGDVKEQRYWDPLDPKCPMLNVSEDEIAEQVLSELRTSVRLRKTSDVPVGVFLSGGIDSSTNTALFSEGEDQPVHTFSIGYEGEYASYQNELHFARQMADEVNAVYHDRLLTLDDMLEFLPQMIALQDEPIADPVCFPVYFVSKLARDNGIKVCQVGEGADELFCGYPSWKTSLSLQSMNSWPVPNAFKKLGLGGLKLLGKENSYYYEWLRRGTSGEPVFWSGAEAFLENGKRSILSDRMLNQFKGYSSWEAIRPIRERFLDRAEENDPLNWMSYVDLNFRLPELLLMRVDKMSMGVSLEGRVPFLDHKFVELAMRIPASVKLKDGNLKHILKKAVRGVIPDNLIDRKKQGFGVPVSEWLLGRLGDTVNKEVLEFCEETDFFDRKIIKQFLESRNSTLNWYLLNLALSWKTYFK